MIEPAIYSKLSATSAITDIVSTRIFAGYAPQGTTIPYIAYSMYSSDTNEAMSANIDIENASYSFTVVSKDYDQARLLTQIVKETLERFEQSSPIAILHTRIIRYTPCIYSKDIESYHRGVDVSFEYRPSTI